jgi:hypothetical protein
LIGTTVCTDPFEKPASYWGGGQWRIVLARKLGRPLSFRMIVAQVQMCLW